MESNRRDTYILINGLYLHIKLKSIIYQLIAIPHNLNPYNEFKIQVYDFVYTRLLSNNIQNGTHLNTNYFVVHFDLENAIPANIEIFECVN